MNDKPLSKRQQNILDFTRDYMSEQGRPPTIREIGSAVGITSTSVVNYNLAKLEERGYLDRDPDVSRGLRLTEKADGFGHSAVSVAPEHGYRRARRRWRNWFAFRWPAPLSPASR